MVATKTCFGAISDLILFTFLRRVGEQVHWVCFDSRKTPPREYQRVQKHPFNPFYEKKKPISPRAGDSELM